MKEWIVKVFSLLNKNKEWFFSGIGVNFMDGIRRFFTKKNRQAQDKNPMQYNEIHGNNNVIGNGNTVNYYADKERTKGSSEKSLFAQRFEKMVELLNDARIINEKEHTVESVSFLLGLENAGELIGYLKDSERFPDVSFLEKFVKTFAVNREWMIKGQGDAPFASNIDFFGDNPMDILRDEEDLDKIESFYVVIGLYAGLRHAVVVRKMGTAYFEVYPKCFVLHSKVGGGGAAMLTEFHEFLCEAYSIHKLYPAIFWATSDQFADVICGKVASGKVRQFMILPGFLDAFSSLGLKRGMSFVDEDMLEVQEIIKCNLSQKDKFIQKYDRELIEKNLESHSEDIKVKVEENKDIDDYDKSTTFFDYRFCKAFPGVRGIREFTDAETCIQRLEILLKQPLHKKRLEDPIWWFRGSRNLPIREFTKVTKNKFLMNTEEIKVKRVVAYGAAAYYKKFVYIEAEPEVSTGVYGELSAEEIEYYRKCDGEYHEEYAIFRGRLISREEYDDGAAVIDGKVVDLEKEGGASLRIRHLTPYNFIICAQFNPINKSKYDSIMKQILEGILEGENTVEDIAAFVEGLSRHKKD